MLRKEIEAKITSDSYVCNGSFWTTDYHIEPEGNEDFEEIKKQFEGKKVRILIEEIK